MKFDPAKDLYAILGVSPTASHDEISQAFKVRTRILHPDRFDRATQSLQWEEANEMQTDLNIAFQVLRDARSRDLYDQFKGLKTRRPPDSKTSSQASSSHTSTQRRVVQPNITSYTQCSFFDLPEEARSNLKARQKRDDLDQVRINLSPVFGPFVQAIMCPVFIWLTYLGAKSYSYNELWWMFLGLSAAGSYMGFAGINKIQRHFRSEVRPNFYLTPLHLIKTDYDFVWIWPLSDVKEKNYLDHYYNGAFNGRTVSLHMKTGLEQIRIGSIKQANDFLLKYERFTNAWNSAVRSSNIGYFNENNDLQSIRSEKIQLKNQKSVSHKFVVLGSTLSAVIIYLTGSLLNNHYVQNNPRPEKKEGKYPNKKATYPRTSTPTQRTADQDSPKPAYPEQPLPSNGSVVRFTVQSPQAPFKIDNSQGDHALIKLVDANTGSDVLTIFVRAGSIAETEVPLGTYQARYASGTTWYGYTYYFGPGTSYSKADRYLGFYEEETALGSRVSGCEITLYKVRHGNLSTSRINPSQF